MTAREIRQKYLEFFRSKGHDVHPSGSLVPYDVTGRLDESLLFNGAGMVQFKPYFRGVATPPNPRLVTAQKCVRTGDIESVGDLSHLTFFEMLGNFSFGDYFKSDAIAYSWEFLTSSDWLGLDPTRLSFTVFEDDDEAFDAWATCASAAGIDPATRIFRLDEETNYWPAGAFSKGPPGPCGPNSEMFYWTSNTVPPPMGPYSREQWIADDEAKNWLEIWNDVFIQFEWQGELKNPARPADGYRKTAMPDLPFRSIDTGMGLERTAAVLGGFSSVYDTDVFAPILGRIQALSGKSYGANELCDTAMRVIADHIRTACFCIADGVLPSNGGRGYVLRRLIRRAVLKGQRVLGIEKPFFHEIFLGVLESMGDHYGELRERREIITETLQSEESLFRRTVNNGLRILMEELESYKMRGVKQYDSAAAFMLYDTFGFPFEVTQEICAEQGFEVSEEGFEAAMREAQERSRGASGMDNVYAGVAVEFVFKNGQAQASPTVFIGYEAAGAQTLVTGALPELDEEGRCTGRIGMALQMTPFYAESGGQISDTGSIVGEAFEMEVLDLVKQDGVYVHLVQPTRWSHPDPLSGMPGGEAAKVVHFQLFDKPVQALIDVERRRAIMRNHTATHLLHAALRQTLGTHVTQAGSLVEPGHLRFDFTHGKAMTAEELARVEHLVNEHVMANLDVITFADLAISEAKARGAMALFGEKYGDKVRMVEIGEFSRELCGGTHVGATGEIGAFKITSEASAASGVRRIQAVTGFGALQWFQSQIDTLREASTALKSNPHDLVAAIEKTLGQLKDERKKREQLAAQGAGGDATETAIGAVTLVTQKLTSGEAKDAQLVADRIVDGKPNRVALVALVNEGKVSFVAKAGPDAVAAGAHAGNLVREMAKLTGGGGGGKADFATAGGRDASQLDAALSAAASVVTSMLG